MRPLRSTLVTVARWLDERAIPYVVIGGMANLEWGAPRTTTDIDITIQASDEVIVALASEIGQTLVGDAPEFIARSRVLPIRLSDGTPLDLVAATLAFEHSAIERARSVDIDGYGVRFCSPEDLIVQKIISDRARDLEDAQGVLKRQRGRLDLTYLDAAVEGFARELERPEILERYEAAKRLAEG